MPSIDKESVRLQVDSIKNDFNELSKAGEINLETKAVMKSMLMIIELIMSIFMEKKTQKTSKNSSIPPSQTETDDTSTDSNKTNKSKNKSNKGSFSNTAERVNRCTIEVDLCEIVEKT